MPDLPDHKRLDVVDVSDATEILVEHAIACAKTIGEILAQLPLERARIIAAAFRPVFDAYAEPGGVS